MTWEAYSLEIIGYVALQTPINEEYVATKMIEKWLIQKMTVEQIALKWNQGNNSSCSSGINKHNIKYDSCEYVESVKKYY